MSDDYKDRFGDTDLDWLIFEDEEGKEKTWDEGKHPRDSSGKWTEGGEGEGGGGESTGAEAFTSMGGKTSGGDKVKGVSDFAKDDVGVYYGNDAESQKLFVDTWNKHVDKTPAEFKKEFFGNDAVKGKLTVAFDKDYRGPYIEFKSKLEDDDGNYIGKMNATFFPEKNHVHMDYYELESSSQGHGVMRSVMAHEMQMWEDMGVKNVDLLANLEVGGYAWGRYGFEPTDPSVWRELASDLEGTVLRLSEGGTTGGDRAFYWDELGADKQDDIENAFYSDTFDEYVDSEVTGWREGGEPLEIAKSRLMDEFNVGNETGWATSVVAGYLKERQDIGEPVPFTAENIVDAIQLDDRRGDVDATIDETKLSGEIPLQVRNDIEKLVEHHFGTQAERNADDIDPPDHLTDTAREYQRDTWNDMSDAQRYEWASRNQSELLEGGEKTVEGSGEIPKSEADSLLKLLRSSDPRALWAVADSKWGKKLLVGQDWNGKFDMTNKDQMARFRAYVEKAKK